MLEDAPAANSRGGVAWRKLLSARKWAEEEDEEESRVAGERTDALAAAQVWLSIEAGVFIFSTAL